MTGPDRPCGERGDEMTTVLYRGPFQGRRIRFLLDSLAAARTPIDLVWLNPSFDSHGERPWIDRLRTERPFLGRVVELDGSWRGFPLTARALRHDVGSSGTVLAIGFTALAYARLARPRHLLWAVNGIPEERLLYDSSVRGRALVWAMWQAARIGPRPDLTIVVSEPMGRLVERRLPGARWAKAPTSVDRDVFRPAASRAQVPTRLTMVYVGSGAPWQGVAVLAPVWEALHRRDPSVHFLVISRDERARELLRGIPASHGSMIAAESPAAVARSLAEAELAFLVRLPNVVNEASFPTKFGEYVASGVPVVTTDVGWDITGLIQRTGCGLLVDPAADPDAIAEEIQRFRTGPAADRSAMLDACTRAADELGREVWLRSLSAEVVTVLGSDSSPVSAR
jgi:glycosyltransferase involved in cell wall biosynthesis